MQAATGQQQNQDDYSEEEGAGGPQEESAPYGPQESPVDGLGVRGGKDLFV